MGGQILIVDRDARFRGAMAATLQRQGFYTGTAGSALAALEQLRHWGCDLLVLDIELPALDGLALLEAMNADEKLRRIPVIVVTGLVDKGCAVKAASLGVCDYLFKRGLSSRVLVERVRRLADRGPRGQGRSMDSNGSAVHEAVTAGA